jgi:hypothetical protein
VTDAEWFVLLGIGFAIVAWLHGSRHRRAAVIIQPAPGHGQPAFLGEAAPVYLDEHPYDYHLAPGRPGYLRLYSGKTLGIVAEVGSAAL